MRNLLLAALLLTLAADSDATDVTIGGSNYTLPSHPRVMMDGSAGTITARVKDPDGAGAGVAPQATDLNPAFLALKDQVRDCRASPSYCSDRYERGVTVLILALDWYMDNSQTDSLTAAKYWLNNVETWISDQYQFGCDVTQLYCGISSWSDWPSGSQVNLAVAYSLIRSELSAGEKAAFAQKMFNDDAAAYEDGCTNQLQQEVGATATFVSGSTSVTGTNLDGLTAGRLVYFKQASGWATIQTVNSPTSITLTGAPQYPLGGNASGQTSGTIYELKPWTSTTCGLNWMLNHHAYTPRSVMGFVDTTHTNSYAVDGTSLVLSSAVGLPAPNFYLSIPGRSEVVKATGVVGNTVTLVRGQFGTTPQAAQYPPRSVYYSRYIPATGSAEYAHNLVIQKTYGLLMMALALADDSETARVYVGTAADTWITSIYPKNRDMWTGLQQGGSSGYGNGTHLTENFAVTTALKMVSAALDKSAGNWLANAVYLYLYGALPTSATSNVPWGQPDLSQGSNYASHSWSTFQTYLFGESSDQAKYWNYYQRNLANFYTRANLTAGSNETIIPRALLFWQESDTSTDYRSTIATEKAFNVVDGTATKALSAWVSRTGFTSTSDSLVWLSAWSLTHTNDHMGTGSPGSYRIFKQGWQVSENGAYDMGAGSDTNMMLFGGASNMASAPNHVLSVGATSGVGWASAVVNAQSAYSTATGVTRALRRLIHFKKAASPDYLVVHSDMATSSAKTLGMNLYFDKTSGEASSITDTLPDIVWTGPNRRVSTTVVLPSGVGVARTAASLTNSFRENVCASTDGATCASVTSAEFLIVHRPSTSTSDTMPTVAALGTIDSDYVGVQIEGEAPSVAVFPRAGAYQTSTSFTSTHSGTAQYVVTGLESGIYDVVRGVTTIVDDETLDANGTIAFESVAGAFTITRAGEVPAITITTTTLSNAVQNQPYSAMLAYDGGTPPAAWNVSAGALCTGLSLSAAGAISGTPTLVETCNFTARVLDDASAEDTQVLALTVQTPPPTLTVSASSGSTTATIQFGTPTLDVNQSCDVVVSSAAIDPGTGLPVGPVATATSSGGPSTRTVTVSGLAPSTSHTANVACGTVASGSTTFVTLAAPVGGTVNWTYTVKPHARLVARSVAKVKVEYNLIGEAADNETASCATGCTLTLPLLSGQLYEIRHIWLTAADAVVATSRKGTVAVP